jgi:hypothetical protein
MFRASLPGVYVLLQETCRTFRGADKIALGRTAIFAVAVVSALLTPRLGAHAADGVGSNAAAAPPAQVSALDINPQAPPVYKTDLFDSGKLLATGGVAQVEGAGGGGLAPWALIPGYGTRDAIGANVHFTLVPLSDFTLRSAGLAVGFFDRVEMSVARQAFDTGTTGSKLGLGKGFTFHQDIFGAKVKLIGDAVYDQASWLPQIAAGVQYKTNDRGAVIHAIGGSEAHGVDYYLSATKLLLAESLLVSGAIRETKANQFGILGFGGDKDRGYSTEFEGSLALLLTRRVAIGAEYRTKPDNLSFAREQNAMDVFCAFFLNKNLSATLAYVDLGDIATIKDQRGIYLSFEAGF